MSWDGLSHLIENISRKIETIVTNPIEGGRVMSWLGIYTPLTDEKQKSNKQKINLGLET